MVAFIERSMRDSQEGKRNFKNLTFSLDNESKDKATDFEISFLMENQIVTYNFSLYKGDIASESLTVDDLEIFRRDASGIVTYSEKIFHTKDELEVSHLTSLSEYKFNGSVVRSDERYAKNYLRGKYGAIPYIKNDMIHNIFKSGLGD
ncbi:hypothetical protein SZO_17560 [Streptococcus equi subsp. zooepidemicus]|uniref:Uncharacterized protein n=1 Tax=Streptococcus equi subsp. zooepidemicus (strain H70) TaxID=553483 RepID=C0MFI8_STRS7|nr:hypothetical protein [Streptococcus equi]CAX00609.1 hypothetical protein SZO_17560 [Streptococcus equi subsp. zooepidemicus]